MRSQSKPDACIGLATESIDLGGVSRSTTTDRFVLACPRTELCEEGDGFLSWPYIYMCVYMYMYPSVCFARVCVYIRARKTFKEEEDEEERENLGEKNTEKREKSCQKRERKLLSEKTTSRPAALMSEKEQKSSSARTENFFFGSISPFFFVVVLRS